jgi:hypothetical protein
MQHIQQQTDAIYKKEVHPLRSGTYTMFPSSWNCAPANEEIEETDAEPPAPIVPFVKNPE